MDYAAFDAIMREGIIVRWIVPAALVAATLVGVAWYFISKHRNGIASDRSLGFTLVMAAALVVFASLSLSDTEQMMHDLKNQSYTVAHGEYECEYNNGKGDALFVMSITTDDGERISLYEPVPSSRRTGNGHIIVGEYTATVWYGVESHCIVAFVPDEPIPDE